MKKLIKCLLCTLMISCIVLNATGCLSIDTSIEDFEYEFKDGYATITGYKGAERVIHIPSKIEGRTVIAIGEHAFEEYDLTEIYLPKDLLTIGRMAFYNCVCLEKVVFTGSVEEIDSFAFNGCTSLKNISFPKTLKEIGGYAFCGCESLEKVKLPEQLETIENDAFEECDKLKELKIPENTDANIVYEVTQTPLGNYIAIKTPVGSVSFVNDNNVKKFPTTLIVKKGSKNHNRLLKCEKYVDYKTY